MEKVNYQMDIIEKDYFGLQYTDHNHVSHWIDPTKPVKKQIKSEKQTNKLEYTSYQYFPQSVPRTHFGCASSSTLRSPTASERRSLGGLIDAQNTSTFRFLYIDPSLSQVPVLSTVEVGLALRQVGVSLRHLRRLGRSFIAM